MEIVIDIPEEQYEYIKGLYKACTDYRTTLMLYDAVRNGAPLPKGHGRLIDADELQRTYCDDNCGQRKCVDAMDRCVFISAVLESQTIVEAEGRKNEADN